MRRSVIAAVAAVGLLLAACGSGGGSDSDESGAEPRTLTVFAAASLTDSFEEIASDFEAEHEGVTVDFNFGGSSDLVAQLQSGAPADVFASADVATMTKATDDELVEGDPELFATNVLQIATPPDNPAGVEELSDLADDDVQVVLCAPEVPCGAASAKVEEAAGIDVQPVSEEQAVTDVLGKVSSGEADAGLVYVTDVIGAGDDVLGIDFPESAEAVNEYPIAALADSEQTELAQQFVAFVLSGGGQKVLADAGFGAP